MWQEYYNYITKLASVHRRYPPWRATVYIRAMSLAPTFRCNFRRKFWPHEKNWTLIIAVWTMGFNRYPDIWSRAFWSQAYSSQAIRHSTFGRSKFGRMYQIGHFVALTWSTNFLRNKKNLHEYSMHFGFWSWSTVELCIWCSQMSDHIRWIHM